MTPSPAALLPESEAALWNVASPGQSIMLRRRMNRLLLDHNTGYEIRPLTSYAQPLMKKSR